MTGSPEEVRLIATHISAIKIAGGECNMSNFELQYTE
jgi:hypothetical protein